MSTLRPFGAVLLALAVIATACGDDTTVADQPPPPGPDGTESAPPADPDPVPSPPPGPCDDVVWVTVDNGAFSMAIPADLVDQEAQGTDSLVGQYQAPGMEVFFDYGGFTNDFSELVDAGAVVETVTVDGFEGSLVTANPGTAWAERYLTGLYVSTDAADGFANALGLAIVHDDEDDRAVARCVAESVDFTLG